MISILVLGSHQEEKIIVETLLKNDQINVYESFEYYFENIRDFCLKYNVGLVYPSTENYLCKGIVNYLNTYGIRV